MNKPIKISGELLGRNTLFNFIGQVIPLLVGVVAIPFIVQGLGTERFGLLSLAWVILGYFSVFDLGLGRATTKFVAEALGKGKENKGKENQVPRLVWTAVTVQAILGVIGAFALIGITPLLVERMLKIPSELIEEARSTFYLLALSVPVILISGSLGGVLEATQRFDLFNIVRIIASSFSYILPLLGMLLGFGLPGIVGLIFLARIGALIAFAMISLSLIPELRRYSGSFSLFPRLFSFGGWVMVSSIISPLLVYLDRFLIGSLLSMSAVAYYSAPYEIVTRLVIIPASLTKTLFPAFSALEGVEDKQRLGVLFARSIKYLLIALGPLVLLIGLLARSILQIWLGVDFAKESTLILQILSFGVLINSLALIPFTLLQGIGRPDLPAKFHLLELSIYVGTAWLLISQWGITGAAAAWAFRVALDALLLFGASLKVNRFPSGVFTNSGTMLAGLVLLLFSVVAYGVKILTHTLPLFIQGVLLATIFAIFAWFIWIKILDMSDKGTILKAVKIAEVLVHKSPF